MPDRWPSAGPRRLYAVVSSTTPRLYDETFARVKATLAAKTLDQWKAKLRPKTTDPT